MWRVVGSSRCSGLHEIEAHWSLDDLVKAHLALDLDDDLAAAAEEKAQQKPKG